MEHFSVIQSLIRIGLTGDRDAFEQQVIRLRTRLEKTKNTNEVKTINALLHTASTTKKLQPTHVKLSRTLITGERLTPETYPPVDRETGAQLCTINFDDGSFKFPILATNVKLAINGLIEEWENATTLKEVDIEPTRTLLIYGPPGSGKTLTANYIAARLSLPLITARIDGLISSFLGKTAQNIAHLFDFANRYACVLLLDEFDAIAKLRDDPHEVGEIKRVVNTLLQNLDQRQNCGVTIAITNHDGLLDPAVWRRFETQVHIDKPDQNALNALIAQFLLPIKGTPEIIQIFAYCLDGYSGADIERICASVKRTMALTKSEKTAQNLFQSLMKVATRLPNRGENTPLHHLASNPKQFIWHITNDPDFDITQEVIARATGYSQPQISSIKRKMELQNGDTC
ncbi:MAG: ATP-binding protein [Aestuariivita sp.]|nr:ATP-binding protein [Aestuariivita sp.]